LTSIKAGRSGIGTMGSKEIPMPDLPMAQQIYLGGVLCAFAAFMAALAWAHFQSNRPKARTHSVRARQRGQGRAAGQMQTAKALQSKRT
jgi:hypothetical protein